MKKMSTVIIMTLFYFLWGTKLIVNAMSAENIIDYADNSEQKVEVQVISEDNVGKTVEITHSEPRIVDGIYYTIIKADGERAYCVQSSKDTPKEAIYEVTEELNGTDSLLNKIMYYAYGNPGYRPELWIADCMGDEERAYLRSHIVMSYAYDPDNTLKRELIEEEWGDWWRSYIQEAIAKIEKEPDVPTLELQVENVMNQAFFDRNIGMQRTKSNTLIADWRNQIKLDLPEGLILVNESKGIESEVHGTIAGGDNFYFKFGINSNDDKIIFEKIKGELQEEWTTLVVKTSSDKQNIGYGVWVPKETESISLEIIPIPSPEVEIIKTVNEKEKVYKSGEVIPYKLEITQKVEGAVAKELVIEDRLFEDGVKILYDSIHVYNSNDEEMKEILIEKLENGFRISGMPMQYLEFSNTPGIRVEYQVLIESKEITTVKNKAVVWSENAPEDEDDEEVSVEKEPEIEKTEVPKEKPKAAPKTGDATNLISFILLVLLSCVLIVKYVRRLYRK